MIVGVHNDSVINSLKYDKVGDNNYPIMNLQERVLSLLGCKYADDVLIDAPYVITRDMINSLHISVVVVNAKTAEDDTRAHAIPVELGIVQEIDVSGHATLSGNLHQLVHMLEDYGC